MKTALTALALALALAAPARAQEDPLRIAGGPRQLHDQAHCAAYQPVWPLRERTVVSIPAIYEYGPEALIPTAPAENTDDPQATDAVRRWMLFAQFNAAYSGRGSMLPLIGYDQLKAAFAIIDEGTTGGPRLPPVPLKPGTSQDAEKLRDYRIRIRVRAMSALEYLSRAQLDRITEVMLQVPTCGGVVY